MILPFSKFGKIASYSKQTFLFLHLPFFLSGFYLVHPYGFTLPYYAIIIKKSLPCTLEKLTYGTTFN